MKALKKQKKANNGQMSPLLLLKDMPPVNPLVGRGLLYSIYTDLK